MKAQLSIDTQVQPENWQVESYLFADDGVFPNSRLPVLYYRSALSPHGADPARVLELTFERHNWTNSWRNGIYSYHHYHSTSHEVLGVYAGTAEVQLGGEKGRSVVIRAGDVLVIPAGVAHQNRGATNDFAIVGAYPDGRDWDVKYGRLMERAEAEKNIGQVPLPDQDPVFGTDGPLLRLWRGTAKFNA
jgi:uncharacterized protein YjlB